MNKLVINRNMLRIAALSVCVCAAGMVSCGSSEEEEVKYDPSRSFWLDSFYPEKGKYQEKVMLNGENFPNDPEAVRVYFNHRRAPVIGSTGMRMYVRAPRLPGKECVISVVVGADSVTYNDVFHYEESMTVTTLAGNGNMEEFQEGELASSVVHPRFLCVDGEGNIFIANRNKDDGGQHLYFMRANEEENVVTRIVSSYLIANTPCADPNTGVIWVPTEMTIGSFLTCDPKEFWAPKVREVIWPTGASDRPTQNGWKHAMVANPSDGYIYTRWWEGHIGRIHPETYEVEVIAKTPATGSCTGLTFNPLRPNIMYMAFSSGGFNNGIYSIDVAAADPLSTLTRLNSSIAAGGHRDGPLATAQFNGPMQIFCDAEGFMYIAERYNHCIRRISPENMVETVLGMPGSPGWHDGTKEEALFNQPYGIGINKEGDVYVGDWGNGRLRKLSIN
ncbi:MAG: IPT/TIG domain-containing protein [Bacteroidales bacterium]|jgi:hypothetical protein|nr:IPT/TIG domain-containing protein [Bacteroidales bacterium]